MALIKCHECNKDVSSESKVCPSCGAKVITPIVPKVKKTSKFNKIMMWFAGVGFFVAVISTMTNKQPAGTPVSGTASVVQITPTLSKVDAEKLPEFKILKKEHDSIAKVTFYEDKNQPATNNAKYIGAYIGWNDGKISPYLMFKLSYAAQDWLFINKFTIDADGQQFEYGKQFERDHQETIWEWINEPATKDIVAMLNTVANAKKVTIRFTGRQYHDDFIVPQKQKAQINNVLKAFNSAHGVI